jgi:hypothetical protein
VYRKQISVGGVLYKRNIGEHYYLGKVPSTSFEVPEKQGSEISRYKVQLNNIAVISAG